MAAADRVGIMLVVSFVVVGVGPRTLGRQHAERGRARRLGRPVALITRSWGRSRAADPDRQRDDARPRLPRGPFATETELRELVDLAEASAVIESEERKMIHSVFELATPSPAR